MSVRYGCASALIASHDLPRENSVAGYRIRYSASIFGLMQRTHSLGLTACERYICKTLLPAYVPVRVRLTADPGPAVVGPEETAQRANKKLPSPHCMVSLMERTDGQTASSRTCTILCFHCLPDDDTQQPTPAALVPVLLNFILASLILAAVLLTG